MYTYEVGNWLENGRNIKIVGRNKKETKRKAEQFLKEHPYFEIRIHYQGDGK